MGAVPKPGSKPHRAQLRNRLTALGFQSEEIITQLCAELIRNCGRRPREAWRLARELSLDEVAARFNVLLDDPRAPMRKGRIWDYEKWPPGGARPTLRTLRNLAQIYDTTWDQLVDLEDLAHMPPSDKAAYHRARAEHRDADRYLFGFSAEPTTTSFPRLLIPDSERARVQRTGLSTARLAYERNTARLGHGKPAIQLVEEVVMAAARDSARFGQRVEQTNVGPYTFEELHTEVYRIVDAYPNRPVFPTFLDTLELRDCAFQLIEGRQHPAQSRDLYLLTGMVCSILSNASFDLGYISAAQTQARTAYLCAELAGSNWLRAWIRGTQSLVAYWDDQFDDAVNHAQAAWDLMPEQGSARVRLAANAARAHARRGDSDAADEALTLVSEARDQMTADDDPGGMFAFPLGKQLYCESSTHLWLGGDRRLRHAESAAAKSVAWYEQPPQEERRLGELCLGKLDLAAAQLAMEGPEGAAGLVREVIETMRARRVESVIRRLRQLDGDLATRELRAHRLARTLRSEIEDIRRVPTPSLPSGVA